MTSSGEQATVALITGSSGGIGGATARRLARPGVMQLLAYGKRQVEAEAVADSCRAQGAIVETSSVDLRDGTQTAHLVGDCFSRFGRLDVLVHCAGIAQESLLATLDDTTIEELMAVHVRATITLVRSALRPMITQRFGRIVLLSSVAAQKPGRGASVYAGCKGFIESFAKAVAVEVGRKGITVNCVSPGLVDTRMTHAVRALVGSELTARSSLSRMALPEEIAEAIEFLCSSRSSYVNGHVLSVDGAYLGPP